LRGIGATSMAIALPGRDIDLVQPERAVRDFLNLLELHEEAGVISFETLTVLDSSSPTKAMREISRMARS
jgi:hypothetical protein